MGKKGGKAPPARPIKETPPFLFELDNVFIRSSKTQIKIIPKSDLLHEPPNVNMSMGYDSEGKQTFSVQYKKPIEPPKVLDVAIETDKPKLLYIKPAEILAKYKVLTNQDIIIPTIRKPHSGKYVLNNETMIMKYKNEMGNDSDDDEDDESDDDTDDEEMSILDKIN